MKGWSASSPTGARSCCRTHLHHRRLHRPRREEALPRLHVPPPDLARTPRRSSSMITARPSPSRLRSPACTAAGLAPGGDFAAVAREDGRATLVSLPSGEGGVRAIPSLGGEMNVSALAVSAGGHRLAIAGHDGSQGMLRVYAREGTHLTGGACRTGVALTRSLVLSADGRTLFAGDDLTAHREGPPLPHLTRPQWPACPSPCRPGSLPWSDATGSSSPTTPSCSGRWGRQAMYYDDTHGARVSVSTLDLGGARSRGRRAYLGRRRVIARLHPFTDRKTGVCSSPGATRAGKRPLEVRYVSDGRDKPSHHRPSAGARRLCSGA